MLAAHSSNYGLKEGSLYRRPTTGAMIETAEVLEVGRDRMGIPHVRFELRVAYGSGSTGATREQRTLSLDSFYARYRERI